MAKRPNDKSTAQALHDPAQDSALAEGRHGRPFDCLGLHPLAGV